ncbi:MAG: hypothetical protein V8R14_02050 [Clostridia bacterium]
MQAGKARMMVIPADAEQLSAVLGVLSGSGVQYMVLGKMSLIYW